jgi:CheY-like chemotaxis protein
VPSIDLSKIRFLIVDDQEFVRTLTKMALTAAGARQFVFASNGEDALKVIHKGGGRIDFIICDWNMEGMNGLQLLQKLRAGEIPHIAPETPFLLLTGHADSTLVNYAVELDASGYLVKPTSHQKLVQAVTSGLSKSWKLKGPKHYQAVPGLESPSALKGTARSKSWVVWVNKTPQRDKLEHQRDLLEREARQLKKADDQELSAIKNVHRAELKRLVPGMILAEDILDDSDRLMIGAGAVLNADVIKRLMEFSSAGSADMKLLVGERQSV